VLQKAEALFAGSAEEIIILQAACDVAIHKSDVGAALKRLRAIKASSPSYRAARTAIAEISLMHRADRRAFVAAYLDIVETYKDYDAYVLCGDAFLRIQVRRWGHCERLARFDAIVAKGFMPCSLQSPFADVYGRVCSLKTLQHQVPHLGPIC
jgi:hypothetical protein